LVIGEPVRPGCQSISPNVAKVGGIQSQGAKGAAVVNLLQALGNAGSGALRLSWRTATAGPEGPKRWRKTEPILECTTGFFLSQGMDLH
jgi:hypothetical protein